MPTKFCNDCSVKLGFFKKKVQCELCNHLYCLQCFAKVKINREELQQKLAEMTGKNCLTCVVLKHQNIKREELFLLGNKQLTNYLNENNISINNCKEKYHLVDLIMENAERNGFVSRNDIEKEHNHENFVEQLRQAELMRQQEENQPHSSQNSPSTSRTETDNVNNTYNTDNVNRNQTPNNTSEGDSLRDNNVNENTEETNVDNKEIRTEMFLPGQTIIVENSLYVSGGEDVEQDNLENVEEPVVEINVENSEDQDTTLEEGTNTANTENSDQNTEDTETHENLEQPGPSSPHLSSTYSFQNVSPSSKFTYKERGQCKSIEDLETEDDVYKLSVGELKQILQTNFINYRGCCEKRELIDKVKMLYDSEKRSQRDMKADVDTLERDLCKICMDNVINCVLLDCGHLVTCTKCGKRLAECPICRAIVIRVVHIFRV